LVARADEVGNVFMSVPASAGCESAPITVLQAHMDMVCEKNAGTAHDFDSDPIRLVPDVDKSNGEPIVRADNTTLGADNGIGLAMAIAAAVSPDVTHGPIEIVVTMDEETGMTGAKALTPESFKGRRLLNLDSEEDYVLYIGCAGGSDIVLSWDLAIGKPPSGCEACRVTVNGLRGGHSGGDIHEGRGNAIKLLARTLKQALPSGWQIATTDGGQLRNAIPREAQATIVGPSGTLARMKEAAKLVRDEASQESLEPDLSITVDALQIGDIVGVLSLADSRLIVQALSALPHGVLGMHPKVPGLVETSNNVANIKMRESNEKGKTRIEVANLTRSSSDSRKLETLAQVASIGELAGATVDISGDYPGWEPNPDSALLTTCSQVYRDQFGEEPKIKAIHAGLECGIIGQRVGDMDMISFGPTILGAHSPDERVYTNSVAKSWKYLVAVLKELASR